MAKPSSNVTDEQIRDCIDKLNNDGIKVTISSITNILHVRRDRVQHILSQWKSENVKNNKPNDEVDELKQEIEMLKSKLKEKENCNNVPILKKTREEILKNEINNAESVEVDRQRKLELVRKLIKDLNSNYNISTLEILEIDKNEKNICLEQFGTKKDMYMKLDYLALETMVQISEIMKCSYEQAIESCLFTGAENIKQQYTNMRNYIKKINNK